MKRGQIYKGGCQEVYRQHMKDCTSVEYSLDEGETWNAVPVDIGKINYFKAWFRLKENKPETDTQNECSNKNFLDIKEYIMKNTVPKFIAKFIIAFTVALTFFFTLFCLWMFYGFSIMNPIAVFSCLIASVGLLVTSIVSIKDWQKHVEEMFFKVDNIEE